MKTPRLAMLVLALVVLAGTAGYSLIEGWGVWDSFYMTIITVTTVGYREVYPLSRPGQVFTVALLLGGVGAAFYTFTLVISLVIERGLPARFQWRRRAAMLERLANHFIICGYGRIGTTVARQFSREKVPFVVVERDPARAQAAIEEGRLVIEADASAEETLTRAGIARARGLIAAVGSDAENVYTVLSAHVLRPDLPVVARAESEDAIAKLKRAGAARVVSPYQIGATQIAQTALRPAVVDFFELATNADNLELVIEEVPVAAASSFANQSLVSANLRHRFGVIVVGVQRADGRMEFNPEPDVSIRPGDKLVVLGKPDSLQRLAAEALAP